VNFVVVGTSARQWSLEIAVQVTGEPPVLADVPLPANPFGPAPTHALPISGGTMTGPLYLFEDPGYPTEAATKHYVDNVAGISGGPYISVYGGTMQGPLILAEDPTQPLEAATKLYVDTFVGATGFLPVTGGTMIGPLILSGDPVSPLDAVPKRYVDSVVGIYLPLNGGIMTGMLTLSADPATALEAATKQYVDTVAAAPTPAQVLMADTAPASPFSGMLWYDTASSQLFIYYDDGTSAQWVAV
jgi:hypothetical protein